MTLVSEHCGSDLSQAAMSMCLLTHKRTAEDPQILSTAARLGSRNPYLIRAVAYIEAHTDEEFHRHDCAAHVSVTLRQIQPVSSAPGHDPGRVSQQPALATCRILLFETDLPVIDVALSCGYGSSLHFANAFRSRYGVLPTEFLTFNSWILRFESSIKGLAIVFLGGLLNS